MLMHNILCYVLHQENIREHLMNGTDPLISQRPQEYRTAVRTARMQLRARNAPESVRARYLGLLDSAWKALSSVEDKQIVRDILRAGTLSVLYRLPGRGIPGNDWPHEGLSLDDARARLDMVLARGEKSGLDSRTLRLASLIRNRLAGVAKDTSHSMCDN